LADVSHRGGGGGATPPTSIADQLEDIQDRIEYLGINIVDHGALTDGSNSATAFTAAIAAAVATGVRRVYVPPGTFTITSTVTILDNDIEVFGVGDVSVVTSSASSYAFSVTGDRVRFRSLKIVKSTATFGACVYITGSSDDSSIVDCTLDSQDHAVQLGDTNAARTPLRARVEGCRLYSVDTTCYSRTALDLIEKAYHRIVDNQVFMLGTRPGIETWTGATLVQGNRVVAPAYTGGTAGITVGLRAFQQVLSNYVEGFTYGIEVGNTGEGIQIDSNTCVGCGTGIAVSTVGGVAEEAVSLNGNVVIMTPEFTGGNQTCIKMTGCRTVFINGGSLMYDSDGDYTDSSSRACWGIEADNDVDEINMVGVQFTNLIEGIRAGTINASSGRVTAGNCSFENVTYPVVDAGGNPTDIVVGGRITNCYHSTHNYRASYIGVAITRSADHPAANKGFAQFYEDLNTVATVQGCSFVNVLTTTMISDAERALTGTSYKRPDVEIRDHSYVVRNLNVWSEVSAEFTTAGIDVPYDVPIHTWVTGKTFVKTRAGVVTYATTTPVTGTWTAGDLVYNSDPDSGEAAGWVCTTSGTPGTWQDWGSIGPGSAGTTLGLLNIRDYQGSVVSGDWGPAFAAAITDAISTGVRGIFVPADPDPYDCAKVTGSGNLYSIELDGVTDFVLQGEGPGSVIRMKAQDAGGSDWALLKIVGNSSGITVRDLVLDGNKANLTNLDPGEQTHCVKLGAGWKVSDAQPKTGYVRNVKFLNVHFKDPDGDGLLLLGADIWTNNCDVSDVLVQNCRFTGSDRNGWSVNRTVQDFRVFGCYFTDIENNSGESEPTGTDHEAPRRITVAHNHVVHTGNAGATGFSFSGNDEPATTQQIERVLCAWNQIDGARIGAIHVKDSVFANNTVVLGDTTATSDIDPVFMARGLNENVAVVGNKLTRPVGATPGPVLVMQGLDGEFPSGVFIEANECVQGTNGGFGVNQIIDVQQASHCRIVRNICRSVYAGQTFTTDHNTERLTAAAHGLTTAQGPIRLSNSGGALPTGLSSSTPYFARVIDANTITLHPSAADATGNTNIAAFSDNGTGTHTMDVRVAAGIKFATTSADVDDVEISYNQVLGNEGGMTVSSGVVVGASVGDIDHLSMVGNKVYGVVSQFEMDEGSGGVFTTPPIISLNGGTYTTHITGFSTIQPVQIEGNQGGVATFVCNGTPEGAVTAPVGSRAYDLTGGAGTVAYLKESGTGNTGWVLT
jgi:hypothetical protein